MKRSTTNTAARELLASALDECGRPTDAAEVREGRNPFVRGEYALAAIEKSLTQQQGGEQEVGALVGKWRRLASYEDEEGELEVGSESAVRLIRCADELEAALRTKQPAASEGDGVPFGIIDPDYARIYTQARVLAWSEGYALTLHGSFTRDLDLVAVPWTDSACEPEHLVRRLADVAELRMRDDDPGAMPHGRLAWTLRLPGFGEPRWVDFGVMPRTTVNTSKQAAASDNLCGLRNEEGMLSGAELESLIDAAQTTTDNKTVAFLGQVSRDLLRQLHGVESALLAVGKRPPLCDTENAVRFAVGMSWNTNGDAK